MSDGFLDKLRDFFVGSEQEYDDYSEDEMEASKKTDAHVAVGSRANLAALPSKNSKDKIEIVVVNVYCPDEAEKSGWCCKIAREIKAKKCVLVSFDEKTDKNVRTRILDFLSGSVFVSGVNSFKISSTENFSFAIFCCYTPLKQGIAERQILQLMVFRMDSAAAALPHTGKFQLLQKHSENQYLPSSGLKQCSRTFL